MNFKKDVVLNYYDVTMLHMKGKLFSISLFTNKDKSKFC